MDLERQNNRASRERKYCKMSSDKFQRIKSAFNTNRILRIIIMLRKFTILSIQMLFMDQEMQQ